MKRISPLSLLLFTTAISACAESDPNTEIDNDVPLSSEADIKGDAPPNESIPLDDKADAVYPKKFTELVQNQTPVKSQGSRGVCSIFATIAQVENLYVLAGEPSPDFSEQFLQWSVKKELGRYTFTEGSNGDANLEAVVDFGTVREDAWPYQSAPWGAADDAACVGEQRPTKCYTNGEPPATAMAAPRIKLPSSRYINTGSMKAHLTSKRSGVVVGMTFFYQSWNHRASKLPVSAELWNGGFVTYPNATDIQRSNEDRAGHAILIVGWDDEREAVMRDAEGKPLLDGNGNPRKEKGFWLFKNSWGTGSFGIENEFGPGYGWLSMRYVQEYGNAVIAEPPQLNQPRAEVCDDAGMVDEDGDGKANCADTGCATHPACGANPTIHNFSAAPGAAIPDDDAGGVSSTINVSPTGTVGSVKVNVDITHSYRGDLTLTLTHGQKTVTFFSKEGGGADDIKETFTVNGFEGAALAGPWVLKVVDSEGQDTGTLNRWALEIAAN